MMQILSMRGCMNMEIDKGIMEILKNTDTPTVANAIERLNVRNRISGFCSSEMRHLTPEMGAMCAFAVTADVQASSADDSGGFNQLFIDLCDMIRRSGKPVAVVFRETGSHKEFSAHCGEIMATIFKRLGAVGVVSDSGVRDIAEIKGMGFQYFAPGFVPSHGSFRITAVGLPVTVCGLQIKTGDLLHGDNNGLIQIPQENIEKLPDIIKNVREAEAKIINYAKSDDFTVEGLMKILIH
jgi:4-hydroxy-4-methyl-2-oxoglutarate aldolase